MSAGGYGFIVVSAHSCLPGNFPLDGGGRVRVWGEGKAWTKKRTSLLPISLGAT